MSGLRFSLAQLNPTLGDLDGNIALIDQAARAAHADRADFVIFSELTLTAYAPGDILQESDFLARCAQAINALCEATRQTPGLYWVIGAPTRSPFSPKNSSAAAQARPCCRRRRSA